MFEIRNGKNEVISDSWHTIGSAKAKADEYSHNDKKGKFGWGPYSVWEVKQVYTTQTIEEAAKENQK